MAGAILSAETWWPRPRAAIHIAVLQVALFSGLVACGSDRPLESETTSGTCEAPLEDACDPPGPMEKVVCVPLEGDACGECDYACQNSPDARAFFGCDGDLCALTLETACGPSCAEAETCCSVMRMKSCSCG